MAYLFKVSALVAIFYLLYKIFLQKDTFFQTNRWFLLIGLFTSLVFPLIIIPIYIEQPTAVIPNAEYDLIPIPTETQTISIANYLPFLYIFGVVIFLIKLLTQIASLSKLIIQNDGVSNGRFTYIETNENIPPFSFFKWIVYNPSKFTKTELQQIIIHEKVHVRQYHSIDVLISQLVCVMLWFNPFIWLYSKILKQNLEFLADSYATSYVPCKKSYQYTLLKTSMPTHQLALSNPFYNSLIKKRIVMLQKSKSKRINQLKHTLVIPILAIFLMSFNNETIYIEKEKTEENKIAIAEVAIETESLVPIKAPISKHETTKNQESTKQLEKNSSVSKLKNHNPKDAKEEKVEFIISKTSSDSDLDNIISQAKKHGLDITFKNVKRNDKGEITGIKITAKSKSSNSNYNIDADEAISPIMIAYNKTTNAISVGNVNVFTKEGGAFVYTTKKGNHVTGNAGKGTNVVVIAEDDDDYKFARAKGTSKFEIVSPTSDEDVEIIVEGDSYIKDNDKKDKNDIIVLTEDINSDNTRFKVITKAHSDGNIIITAKEEKNPLFIIDGEEVKQGIIEDLNPNDIEAINVLKGKTAEKKYGEKGINGVVEITTKR